MQKNVSCLVPNDVPCFPNFRVFTLDDTIWYREYYHEKRLNPYADIHPENMFVWLGMSNDLHISQIDGEAIIQYTNILDHSTINLILLSNPIQDFTIRKIMDYLLSRNLPQIIKEVPAMVCQELNPTEWMIDKNRDSYEYILDCNEQSNLVGKCFREQRSFILDHKSDQIEVKFYEDFNEEIKQHFLHHIQTKPLKAHVGRPDEDNFEPVAILRNLEYAQFFNKKAMLIKLNGAIVSLSMLSYLDDKTASVNHIKVDYSVKDIFRYTIYQLAQNLSARGIDEMNFEQDLGITGMRTFKERLHPSRLLEKRTIRPIGGSNIHR